MLNKIITKTKRVAAILRDEGIRGLVSSIKKSYYPIFLNTLPAPAQPEARIYKDTAKFWNRSDKSGYHRRASRWFGSEGWSEHECLKVADYNYNLFDNLCLITHTKRPIHSMVEWGPGGGALAVRFAGEVKEYYGVDISKPNLDECKRRLDNIQFTGFHPILIDIKSPEECIPQIEATADLFLATAVYMHFPGKEYGIRVTKIANKVLSPSGLAIIQIRYNDETHKLPPNRDYDRNFNEFTSYSLEEFWKIAIDAGFEPLYLVLGQIYGLAYFFLRKSSPC